MQFGYKYTNSHPYEPERTYIPMEYHLKFNLLPFFLTKAIHKTLWETIKQQSI